MRKTRDNAVAAGHCSCKGRNVAPLFGPKLRLTHPPLSSTTGAFSDRMCIVNGPQPQFSATTLLGCCTAANTVGGYQEKALKYYTYGSEPPPALSSPYTSVCMGSVGCGGGYEIEGYQYIVDYGLPSGGDYG